MNRDGTIWNILRTYTGKLDKANISITIDIDDLSFDEQNQKINIFAEYFSSEAGRRLETFYGNYLPHFCTISPSFLSSFFLLSVLTV